MSSSARNTTTVAFGVASDAGDDGMVSRQTASPNASQSPPLSLVRRTAPWSISPVVTSLCEPACEVTLSPSILDSSALSDYAGCKETYHSDGGL